MKQYSFYHIPVLSFFSTSLYRDVAVNWRGTCFPYLLLLLAVCWIPGMINFQNWVSHSMEIEAPKIISQVPVITVADGEASIEEPEPCNYIR